MPDASLQERARTVIGRIERLPSPSVVAIRLLHATRSDDTAASDLVSIISHDPAMAARVVSLCRRCHRGVGVEVDSVDRAVVLLGFEEIRATALAVELSTTLATADADGVAARMRRRAVVVASLARIAAERIPAVRSVEPSAAFLAGLLHDLGHLALQAAIPEAFERVVESVTLGDRELDEGLRRVVGIDGPTAGALLAERWGFPAGLRRSIGPRGHDGACDASPDGDRPGPIAALADLVARRHGIGTIGRRPTASAVQALETAMGLDPGEFERFLPEAVALASRSHEILGLDHEPSESLLVRCLAEANGELDRLRRRAMVSPPPTAGTNEGSGILAAVDPEEGLVPVFEAVQGDARRIDPAAALAIAWRIDGAWWTEDEGEARRLDDDPTAMLARRSGVPIEVVESHPRGDFVLVLSPMGRVPGATSDAWRSLILAAHRMEILRAEAAVVATVRGEERDRLRREIARESDQAVAEIAAGAAHQMNDPLTIVSGRAQMLRGRFDDPVVESSVDEMIDAGARLAGLVAGLHRHAVAADVRLEPIEGSALVLRAAEAAQQRLANLDSIDVDDTAGVVPLRVDVRRMIEVVVEACRNARQAHEEARIRLLTSSDVVDGRWCLQVEDDGPGFEREALDHAFRPFFSLKPAGRRAGLGLAIVRRIVEAHGGTAAVRNREQGGGALMLSLPITRQGPVRQVA